MSSNTKLFTTSDEWKNMNPKQQRERVYSLKDYIYYHKNETTMIYERELYNMSDSNDVEEYNQILRNEKLIESFENTKDAWIHAKTELELVDQSFIHEVNQKVWSKELKSIQKEIELWSNIELVTSQNKPCAKDLHQFPFSVVVNLGILSTYEWYCFDKSIIEVTILKTKEIMYPYVRIERSKDKRRSMPANYISVMLGEKNDTSVLELLVEQKHISHFKGETYLSNSYRLYFDPMGIETMPNVIQECEKLGLKGCPDIFMSLC